MRAHQNPGLTRGIKSIRVVVRSRAQVMRAWPLCVVRSSIRNCAQPHNCAALPERTKPEDRKARCRWSHFDLENPLIDTTRTPKEYTP